MISLIVPVYNVDQYLEKCIQSILSQSFTDFEVLLVDDGSTDHSPEICDFFSKNDKRIKVIHQRNMGLVSARKVGLSKAVGDYIAFVDSDDWVESDYLEKLYCAITHSMSDIAICNFVANYPEFETRKENKINAGIYNVNPELFKRIFPADNPFHFGLYPVYWNKLFKREIIYDSLMKVPSNISMGEDVAGVFPAIYRADKIVLIENHLYHYRQVLTSMTKTVDENYFLKLKVLLDFLENEYGGKFFDSDQIRSYSYYMLSHGIFTLFGKNSRMNFYGKVNVLRALSENSELCRDLSNVGTHMNDKILVRISNGNIFSAIFGIYSIKLKNRIFN